MSALEQELLDAQFGEVTIEIKEESREVIAQWMPGSGAEDFVVSADIQATKPTGLVTQGTCCVPAAAAPEEVPEAEQPASGCKPGS